MFALRPAQLGFPPQWNRDPKTGRVAPLTFGKALDYRDERIVGDIKYLWEPSRHAELLTLAQAWHLSHDQRYAAACRTLLDSWFEQCPYARGPHWASSLEHAMRLINWSFAWHLLGDEREPLRERWLTSIFQHCHFIAGHFSRHSSANNHLLGELTGLFVAATTWPLWPQSQSWRETALRELQQQALVQNGSDGVNREQAVWYHHEVADMLLIAGLVARANGMELAAEYWQRLEAMLDYIASIMDVGGNVPNFGDADDAIVARLDPTPDAHVYRSLLATGAVVFDRPALTLKADTFDDKSRWVLGDRAAERFAALASSARPSPARREFPVAGYYVLGHELDTPREVRIVADAGRLGYLSIAAHGHADALSFTLSAGGEELLIDPGTFAYHTQKQWRDYFRGTSAHNTVRIDGQDQSVGAGNFLWLAHAPVRVLEFISTAQFDRLVAEHDGYRRLRDPVTHRRELSLDHATSRRNRRRRDLLPRVAYGRDVLALRRRLRSDARRQPRNRTPRRCPTRNAAPAGPAMRAGARSRRCAARLGVAALRSALADVDAARPGHDFRQRPPGHAARTRRVSRQDRKGRQGRSRSSGPWRACRLGGSARLQRQSG